MITLEIIDELPPCIYRSAVSLEMWCSPFIRYTLRPDGMWYKLEFTSADDDKLEILYDHIRNGMDLYVAFEVMAL